MGQARWPQARCQSGALHREEQPWKSMTTQTSLLPNGWKQLQTPYKSEGSSMVIRGLICYEFTKSRKHSVFSSHTQLTFHWSLLRPNSQESWKAQVGRIRISTSSHIQEFWLDCDLPQRMIGATLALMRNPNRNQYCDYCKGKWGQLKDGSWHIKAQTPAVWKAVSESPSRKGMTRFYCQPCADEVQNWPNGYFYSLKEQLEDALTTYNKGAYYDEQLA